MALIGYPEALAVLLREVRPLRAARQPLADAGGRVAATTLRSRGDVPPFRNAALDGYAVRGADLAAAPATLRIAGSVVAGAATRQGLRDGEAIAITTGAPLPSGADTVVAIEHTRTTDGPDGSPLVVVGAGTVPGANVRGAGEDFAAGDEVIAAGTVLGPEAMMALAATGTGTVDARGPVRVAVLTTGNELRPAGSELGEAGISDANGPYLAALLAAAGSQCVAWRHAGDRLPDLIAALTALRAAADVIVTTGGVSAGSADLVPAAVAAAGGQILFHKVAIRPGKPLLVARFPDGGWLLGLPGNPVAVAVGARFFLVPLLRALLGRAPEATLPAQAATELRSRGGLWFFGKARVRVSGSGQLRVALLPGQESFRVAPLVAANAWVIVPPAPAVVAPGETVAVVPLAPAGDWLAPDG